MWEIPLFSRLKLKQCRHMVCGSVPFAMMFSTPFVLIFTYYNTQSQAPFRKWNVRLLGRDFLIGWAFFTTYVMLRTLVMDPYCDPTSIHYNKELNAFDRKKLLVGQMQEVLKKEGKPDS